MDGSYIVHELLAHKLFNEHRTKVNSFEITQGADVYRVILFFSVIVHQGVPQRDQVNGEKYSLFFPNLSNIVPIPV